MKINWIKDTFIPIIFVLLLVFAAVVVVSIVKWFMGL